MTKSYIALAAVCSVVSLACAPRAHANHGIRADLPCPYGPGSGDWTATSTASPFKAGLAGTTPVTLQANVAGINNQDELGLVIVSAVQYDSYAAPPTPPVGGCTSTTNSPGPLAQVLDYGLDSSSSLFPLDVFNGSVNTGTLNLAAGDREVEFNYDQFKLGATTPGTASFTLGGVTYTSKGTLIPFSTDNDFLFDSTGKLLGALGTNNGATVVFTGVPTGWTASSGGGTVSAPEIDPSSAAAGLTLLAGSLMVLLSGRRTLKVSR